MAYLDDSILSGDANFQARIRMAMVKAAVAVAGEARTANAVVDNLRSTLAKDVLNNPDIFKPLFAASAIEAGSLVSASTDAALDSAIASVWSDIAGVNNRT